jgi:hypothetical protein
VHTTHYAVDRTSGAPSAQARRPPVNARIHHRQVGPAGERFAAKALARAATK